MTSSLQNRGEWTGTKWKGSHLYPDSEAPGAAATEPRQEIDRTTARRGDRGPWAFSARPRDARPRAPTPSAGAAAGQGASSLGAAGARGPRALTRVSPNEPLDRASLGHWTGTPWLPLPGSRAWSEASREAGAWRSQALRPAPSPRRRSPCLQPPVSPRLWGGPHSVTSQSQTPKFAGFRDLSLKVHRSKALGDFSVQVLVRPEPTDRPSAPSLLFAPVATRPLRGGPGLLLSFSGWLWKRGDRS